MTSEIRVVHVVAKTHLDLGFTALASEVVDRYRAHHFPQAIAVARELELRGRTERLVWTTGSWILHQALTTGPMDRRREVETAVRDGHLAWHALPVTTHTEMADAALVRSGLGISAELDERFGRRTTAAKMTDVPGHTRSLVPLLAESGVMFLHLGVNPAWPVPEVPPVFRWRSPDGAEVVVAYQAGGYGGEVVVPGCAEALAFIHTGDNLGAPGLDHVLEAHRTLAERFPGAEIRASTLDGFARALAVSGAVPALPVVTSEIGDPWLFGAGSDPQKVRGLRDVLRARTSAADLDEEVRRSVDRDLLLVVEHTWGLDQKEALPDTENWDRAGLVAVRGSAEGARFERSWAEQREYVDRARSRLAAAGVVVRGADPPPDTAGAGWTAVEPGQPVELPGWPVHVNAETGSVTVIGAGHRFGAFTYQSFDEADFERFYAQLTATPEDNWWARLDNTKPGIDAAGAVSGRWFPQLEGAWRQSTERLLVRARFSGGSTERLGAPPRIETLWEADGDRLRATVWWADKPASRLPEATWISFEPLVDEPTRWTLDKLGRPVSPLDVVRHGGRGLHAVGEGMSYEGPDGEMTISTLDAPLVAPGRPALLDADPVVPDLSRGFHVLLHDNLWGTNFPMWNEGDAAFRFEITWRAPV